MLRLIIRRLLGGVALIVLLTFITFVAANAIPQNKACMFVNCDTATRAQMNVALHQHGFDRPVWTQYADYMWGIASSRSLGYSWNGIKLDAIIGASLPATASLVAGGMILTVLLALPLGALAALRPRSFLDRAFLTSSVVGLAVHPFVLGIGLATFFHALGTPRRAYCPLTSMAIPQAPITPGEAIPIYRPGQGPQPCGGLRDWAWHMAVPWLVFALFFIPIYLRMIRTRLVGTLSEQYITTARAKGATEARVVVRHALRNATGPLLPMVALDAGTAITAAIYVETIFGLPGLGHLAVVGLTGEIGQIHYDLPFFVALVLTIGVFVVALTTLADIAAAWLDPRIRGRVFS
jgi:peptide/nickel transport system permease protein